MPFRKLLVVCTLILMVGVGAFLWINQQAVGATLTLPDGSKLSYHDVTVRGLGDALRGPDVVGVFHVLEELPWHWRWAAYLPQEARSFIKVPHPSTLGTFNCGNDQTLWFHYTGPELAETFRFFLTDDQGFESEVAETRFNHPMVMLAGAGPRRSRHVRIAVREQAPTRLGAPLSPPLATATMRNPLMSAGPPLRELDPLPTTKTVDGFDVTLQRLVRRKEVSMTSGGMEIHWSISSRRVKCPGWQVAAQDGGTFVDGSSNSTPIGIVHQRRLTGRSGFSDWRMTTGQLAHCGTALFSDDPVWRVTLRLHRTEDNTTDYDSVIKLAGLPVPKPEETMVVNRVAHTTPWTIKVVTVSRNYTSLPGKELISVLGELSSVDYWGALPRVLNNDAKLHTSFWERGHTKGQWLFEVPEGRETWDLEIGIDDIIQVVFQSRVKFLK
jgi:hypothetical protein